MVEEKIVVLATGGTIAGAGRSAVNPLDYQSAQLGVEALVATVPALAGMPLVLEQLAQVDSKDMDAAVWRRLVQRCAQHLADPQVQGVVVTHGTDTLEETAFFLHRVLAPCKPLVLTGAMRPATALMADGPQNLLDAIEVARSPGARGVLAVMAGEVHGGEAVRKRHSLRLDAFSSGEAGPLGVIEDGRLRLLHAWPAPADAAPVLLARVQTVEPWPWVEIVTSQACARAAVVDALVGAGVQGLVVAATGNGTVHRELQAALLRAVDAGVKVLRATRCAEGRIVPQAGDTLPAADALSPVKARIALMLQLLAAAA